MRRIRFHATRPRAAVLAASITLVLWDAGAAPATPLISEIYYDAPGADDGAVFVELSGEPGEPLHDYVLEGVNGSGGGIGPSVALGGVIGPDGLFVVADRTSSGTTSVVGADWVANFDFQNGPDSIRLRLGGSIVDAIGYGVFGAGTVFAGEGRAAPDVMPGSSLARIFANVDTDDNALDFVARATPTPGEAPWPPVPEAGTALLFALGLAGLAAVGERPTRAGLQLKKAESLARSR